MGVSLVAGAEAAVQAVCVPESGVSELAVRAEGWDLGTRSGKCRAAGSGARIRVISPGFLPFLQRLLSFPPRKPQGFAGRIIISCRKFPVGLQKRRRDVVKPKVHPKYQTCSV